MRKDKYALKSSVAFVDECLVLSENCTLYYPSLTTTFVKHPQVLGAT